MTDFITAPALLGISVYGFYKFTELLAHRKERLQMVEKISDLSPNSSINMESIFGSKSNSSRFVALRFGSILLGIGIGLLVGFFICYSIYGSMANMEEIPYYTRQVTGLIYGASTLVFGGISLLICFMIEQKSRNKA